MWRPLGLCFDKKSGDLYTVDACFSLLVVDPAGGLSPTLGYRNWGAKWQTFRFTNDLDINEHEDVIYFTDTSTRFQIR